MTLLAEFAEHASVEGAIEALVAAGVERSAITLYSGEPVELGPGVLDRPSRISLFAVAGAILSGGLATTYMYWTQLNYPIVTGGMPLNSPWATGVITFETTMAGAIAGTLAGLILEGGFLRLGRRGPAAALDSESVFLEAPVAEETTEAATRAIRESGGALLEEPA